MNKLNLYQILGVETKATTEEIKAAYREAIWKNHPDRNTDESALEKSQEINRAYEILCDPNLRAQYDFGMNIFSHSNSLNYYTQYYNSFFMNGQNTPPTGGGSNPELDAKRFRENEEKRKARIEMEKKKDTRVRIITFISVFVFALLLSFGIWVYSKKFVTPQPITDLGGRGLTELPNGLENSGIVNVLYLQNNNLTELPPAIGTLSGLVQLSLANNKLTVLPNEFYNLKTLSVLDLSNNKITEIPPDIASLVSLRELDLRNNQLKFLPVDQINELSHLKVLKVSGNPVPNNYKKYLESLFPKLQIE